MSVATKVDKKVRKINKKVRIFNRIPPKKSVNSTKSPKTVRKFDKIPKNSP